MKKFFTHILLGVFAIGVVFTLSQCKKDNNQTQNNVPNVPVNLTLNLNLPQYLPLQSQGTWIYESVGVRGIVVYHHYDDKFYALERNCPYNPNDSCATVSVEGNGLFLRCGHYKSETDTTWIPCCNSSYSLEGGYLISGPSKFPLKNYRVGQSGSLLQISN
jgi:nitrite reductase/ring-hydroxylating ferredoxin subunit